MTGFSAVNHVGITVSNLDKAIEFYETLTGKKISNKDQIGGKRMAQTQGLDDTLIKYANLGVLCIIRTGVGQLRCLSSLTGIAKA